MYLTRHKKCFCVLANILLCTLFPLPTKFVPLSYTFPWWSFNYSNKPNMVFYLLSCIKYFSENKTICNLSSSTNIIANVNNPYHDPCLLNLDQGYPPEFSALLEMFLFELFNMNNLAVRVAKECLKYGEHNQQPTLLIVFNFSLFKCKQSHEITKLDSIDLDLHKNKFKSLMNSSYCKIFLSCQCCANK